MPTLSIIPTLGIILVPLFALYLAFDKNAVKRNIWIFPAILSIAFAVLTVVAFVYTGPLGFWHLHVADWWGNQVWIDLLLAVAIALFFVIPQARTLGMNVLPWVIFTIITGCIGLLAMTARVLYLRDKANS